MNPRTVYRLLEEAAERYSSAVALYQPYTQQGKKKFHTWTWAEYLRAVTEIAGGLRSLGYGKGDIIALGSETRAEFYLADQGVMANGSIAAALYTSYPASDLLRTIQLSDAKALFAEDPKMFDALKTANVDHFFLLTGEAPGAMTLDALRALGREAMSRDPGLFAHVQSEYTAGDDAILYLTSGATGEPKMAMTTHGALTTNVDMGPAVLPMGPSDRTIAWLPSAHIAQRVVIELLPVRCGMPVYFAESLTKLPHDIKSIKPTIFLAPPRMWERVYTTMSNEINKRPQAVRKMFYGALGLGLKAAEYRAQGKSTPLWMRAPLAAADALVFRKIRNRFGGQLRVAASGAAPLGKDLAAFYEAIGMPLQEGFGLTEGGVATFNPVGKWKNGSIGKPLEGVTLKLGEDSELLISSPCLFARYYKDPQTTAEVLRDGWLYTGDVASIDSEGYVFITGRKKEMIVSSTGKKVFPARVESFFKVEPLISQVVLIGDRLPYVTALITINTGAAESIQGADELKGKPIAEMARSPLVTGEVQKAIRRVNKTLAPFEQIRKWKVLERDFTIEHGELTATMKVRKGKVVENFKKEIAELYAGREELGATES